MSVSSDDLYEVLNPWADADPVPTRGISPRLTDLSNQTIGLYLNSKGVAPDMQAAVQEKLRARFPDLRFSTFLFKFNLEIGETEEQARFEEWVKEVDAVVTAVGD